MRFRAFTFNCAITGALLAAGLASPATAEETSPCFSGDGSIQEVLERIAKADLRRVPGVRLAVAARGKPRLPSGQNIYFKANWI